MRFLTTMQLENDIENCLAVLQTGGIILYPTDTVWAIGCDATNEDAVRRICKLKNRSNEKSMIILLSDEKEISNYVDQPNLMVFDYIKGVNKPTTMIYSGARALAPSVISKEGSVGIRLTDDSFCKQLIKKFGKPIVSTSSNISGYPPPRVFSDIDISIKKGVDYIVHHRQDDNVPAMPSTIIKVEIDGTYEIVRR